jgi:hypothetical protein
MPPYTWAITAGALPPGLSLDSASGVISGVPPHGVAGTHSFTVTVTDMHGDMASNLFSITVADFYAATVTIDMSLLQPCQTMVYADGEPAGDLKGGESLTLSFSLGTTHIVSVDSLVADPGNQARRFKAVDAALTVTEASPNAVFQYTAEYSVSCKAEPPDIIGLPSPDWYPEGSTLTASATEEVDRPTGIQYRFAHWQLPTGETMADPQLSVTVEWGGEIIAAYDTYYLLTVLSEYGTPEGSGYYKADTSASWGVTPAEVEMSGVLGFLGGKLKPNNVEGTEIITSPKTVTILWQSDYKMPILIGTLVLLFLGLGSYLGYRYAYKRWPWPSEPIVKCPYALVPPNKLDEIPQYPRSPYDPEPPPWWEEEPPPKPPPSIPYAFVPLTLDIVWAWIERWNRRLAPGISVLEPWPEDWGEYERRWRQQWELDILDDLERMARDKIADLKRQIWKLEEELRRNRNLTQVEGTNKYRVGKEPLTRGERKSISEELEKLEEELAKWEEALKELRRIRKEIEQRKLRPDWAKPL